MHRMLVLVTPRTLEFCIHSFSYIFVFFVCAFAFILLFFVVISVEFVSYLFLA